MIGYISFLLNLYFAAMLGIAGLAKLDSPESFAITLRQQRILPIWSVSAISRLLPYVEVVLACMLVVGIVPTFTAATVLLLFISFLGVKLLLALTNPGASCGCSGATQSQVVDNASLLVSCVLIALAVLQLWTTIWVVPISWTWRLLGILVFNVSSLPMVWRVVERRRKIFER